jgi:hypothetical protein
MAHTDVAVIALFSPLSRKGLREHLVRTFHILEKETDTHKDQLPIPRPR